MSARRHLTRDDLKRVEDRAKAMDPRIEWYVEAQDYGWRLALCGSLIVADEQVRYFTVADQANDLNIRKKILAAPTFEDFLDRWTETCSHAIARKLHATTPAEVEAAKARANGRIRHATPSPPADH